MIKKEQQVIRYSFCMCVTHIDICLRWSQRAACEKLLRDNCMHIWTEINEEQYFDVTEHEHVKTGEDASGVDFMCILI